MELQALADVSAPDARVAPDYVAIPRWATANREECRRSIRHFRESVINSLDSFEIHDQVVEGAEVGTRMTAHGEERATGEAITLMGINLVRTVDGTLVEERTTWEQLHASKFYAG